jgi:hypothetical protein
VHGNVIFGKAGICDSSVAFVNCVSSISAKPIPMIIPPLNWVLAVSALRMRPQLNDPRKRLRRVSAVMALTARRRKASLRASDRSRGSLLGGWKLLR